MTISPPFQFNFIENTIQKSISTTDKWQQLLQSPKITVQ